MDPILVSSLVFALVFSGALFGMALRRALPQEHFGTDAKETVRLAVGLVVTMTGLVLGDARLFSEDLLRCAKEQRRRNIFGDRSPGSSIEDLRPRVGADSC